MTQNTILGVLGASFFSFLTFASQVEAGEILHLKSGRVDPTALPMLSSQFGVRGSRQHQRAITKEEVDFVIQFRDVIQAEDHRNLVTLGAKIVRYLPDDAFVMRTTPFIARTIEFSSNRIRAVVPYRADWRISSEFDPASVFSAAKRYDILVYLFPEANSELVSKKISAIRGVRNQRSLERFILLRATRTEIESVAEVSGVEWIQKQPWFALPRKSLIDPPRQIVPFQIPGKAPDGQFSAGPAPGVVAGPTSSHSHPDNDPLEFSRRSVIVSAVSEARRYLFAKHRLEHPSDAMVKALLLHARADLSRSALFHPEWDEWLARVDPASGSSSREMAGDLVWSDGWSEAGLRNVLIVDESEGVARGETHSYPISLAARGRSRLKITLAYKDAPGALAAAESLVNDLDLVLVDARGGEIGLGGQLHAHGHEHEQAHEQIEIDVGSGDYEVHVRGRNVPRGVEGRQPYALIMAVM